MRAKSRGWAVAAGFLSYPGGSCEVALPAAARTWRAGALRTGAAASAARLAVGCAHCSRIPSVAAHLRGGGQGGGFGSATAKRQCLAQQQPAPIGATHGTCSRQTSRLTNIMINRLKKPQSAMPMYSTTGIGQARAGGAGRAVSEGKQEVGNSGRSVGHAGRWEGCSSISSCAARPLAAHPICQRSVQTSRRPVAGPAVPAAAALAGPRRGSLLPCSIVGSDGKKARRQKLGGSPMLAGRRRRVLEWRAASRRGWHGLRLQHVHQHCSLWPRQL